MVHKIQLSVLGIEYTSNEYSYRDDGFVEDISEHEKKIYDEVCYDYASQNIDNSKVGGKTMVLDKGHKVIVVFYKRYKTIFKENFVRAHEETHVLQITGRLDILQQNMKDIGLKIDLESYKDVELISDLGGLYALIKHGEDSSDIMIFLSASKKEVVLEIYRNFLNSLPAQ